MAKVLNGDGTQKTPDEERSQQLSDEFSKEVWGLFAKYQQAEKTLNPTQLYQTLALALMHMSAVTAVDCHITDMQFIGMAKKLHDDVLAKAPRFS